MHAFILGTRMDQPRNIQLIAVMALAWALLPLSCAEDSADPAQDSGLGGQAGAGGGGGGAGAGAVDAAEDSPFAQCTKPPPWDCSYQSLCTEMECGKAWSMLDENGCERPKCTRDSDCTSEQRCLPSALVKLACQGSVLEFCSGGAASCTCSFTADCTGFVRCVPKALAPEVDDCKFTSSTCWLLIEQKSSLQSLGSSIEGANTKQAIDTCITKLEAQMQQHGC